MTSSHRPAKKCNWNGNDKEIWSTVQLNECRFELRQTLEVPVSGFQVFLHEVLGQES